MALQPLAATSSDAGGTVSSTLSNDVDGSAATAAPASSPPTPTAAISSDCRPPEEAIASSHFATAAPASSLPPPTAAISVDCRHLLRLSAATSSDCRPPSAIAPSHFATAAAGGDCSDEEQRSCSMVCFLHCYSYAQIMYFS